MSALRPVTTAARGTHRRAGHPLPGPTRKRRWVARPPVPRTEIVATGNELLAGDCVNTNAATVAQLLRPIGLPVQRVSVVGDDPAELVPALREALARADVLIATGGLGPTRDDRAREALVRLTGCRLVPHGASAARIHRWLQLLARRPTRSDLLQATVPSGAVVLPNPVGAAPAFALHLGRTHLLWLPGVPQELEAILAGAGRRYLARHVLAPPPAQTAMLRTTGLREADVSARLAPFEQRWAGRLRVGYYPSPLGVAVKLTALAATASDAARHLNAATREAARALGDAVYTVTDEPLEAVVGRALRRRHLTVAVAESCTGGLLGDTLTNVPGSSGYFLGGMVAYSRPAKARLLGIPRPALARLGTVSRTITLEMARAARCTLGADLGLAITGQCGPGRRGSSRPVGEIHVALSSARARRSQTLRLVGTRAMLKRRAVTAALDLLRRTLSPRG